MIYLYVKTHNITGLKYLGQTTQDPFNYLGSGLYWMRHLKEHGSDITTEILFEHTDISAIKEKGLYYSKMWNVVDSSEWANLTNEEGAGGPIFKGRKHRAESIQKMRERKLGKKFTDEHKKNLSQSHKGIGAGKNNHFFGKNHSDESKKQMSVSLTGKIRSDEFKQNLANLWTGKPKQIVTCPHCGKEGGKPVMTRYHFEKCKNRPA